MGIKHHVNEEFFDTWSPSMAYTLGYIFADGHLIDSPKIRAKYVAITSTDFESVTMIRTLLESHHTIRVRKEPPRKTRYQVKIGSAPLFQSLVTHGVTPNKSLTMMFPQVPKKYLPYFVLGYFDGDGCVYVEAVNSDRPKHLKTIFTCGSKHFLDSLHSLLKAEIGVQKEVIYAHGSTKSTYQLVLTARDSIRLYLYIYQTEEAVALAMKRKYNLFRIYFDKLGLENKDLPAILLKKGPVAK